MGMKVSKKISASKRRREKRRRRIRSQIFGTTERPRLSVYRSNTGIYCQLVDDVKGITLAAASTKSKELKGKVKDTVAGAKAVRDDIGDLRVFADQQPG